MRYSCGHIATLHGHRVFLLQFWPRGLAGLLGGDESQATGFCPVPGGECGPGSGLGCRSRLPSCVRLPGLVLSGVASTYSCGNGKARSLFSRSLKGSGQRRLGIGSRCSQASPSRPCPGNLGRNCKTMRFFTEEEGLPCFGVQYTKLCLGHTALGMVFVKIGLILSNMIFRVKTTSLISAV